MSLYDDIANVDAAIFSDPALMPGVVPIEYVPRGEVPIPLTATLDHGAENRVDGVVVTMTTLFIPRGQIPQPSIGGGGDRVIARDKRGDRKTYYVADILKSDAGGYLLRLEMT